MKELAQGQKDIIMSVLFISMVALLVILGAAYWGLKTCNDMGGIYKNDLKCYAGIENPTNYIKPVRLNITDFRIYKNDTAAS